MPEKHYRCHLQFNVKDSKKYLNYANNQMKANLSFMAVCSKLQVYAYLMRNNKED